MYDFSKNRKQMSPLRLEKTDFIAFGNVLPQSPQRFHKDHKALCVLCATFVDFVVKNLLKAIKSVFSSLTGDICVLFFEKSYIAFFPEENFFRASV